jgi:tetratricopeptide (TPR) repeat protein
VEASLYGIAAELARLAVWTSYDAGHHGTAQRYYLIALRAAHEGDATGIGANILRCMAHQARSLGDPASAVDLLRSARRGTRGRITATESAAINAGLARAYGLTGDYGSAMAAADGARADIEKAKPDEDPPYIYWVGKATVASATGNALLSTGRAQAAIPHLRASADLLEPDLPRDQLEYRTRLAVAYAAAGEPDQAITLAHDAIRANPIASVIVESHVSELDGALRRMGHPGAPELVEHARSLRVAS